MSREPGDGTRCVRAGVPAPVPGEPFLPGPVLAAPYHLDPELGPAAAANGYGRVDNPTWRALESAIGYLEGGECVVFGSGMAAVSAALLTLLRPGDTVLLPADGYYKTRAFAAAGLPGVTIREVPTAGPYPPMDGVRLVLLETPANPGLDVCDIAALAEEAHAAGALVAVDSTTATPLGQQPLALGADLVIHSASKFLGGHADALGGALAGRKDLVDRVYHFREITGAALSPHDAYMLLRGMKTLALRIERQNGSAMRIADWLEGQDAVDAVFYPGLASNVGHEIAARQMRGFGGMLSFSLVGGFDAVRRFLPRLRLAHRAANLGAVETIAGIPATTSHVECTAEERAAMGIPEALIRLSVGIEDPDDLIADLDAALGVS